jgi:hypothetical protein
MAMDNGIISTFPAQMPIAQDRLSEAIFVGFRYLRSKRRMFTYHLQRLRHFIAEQNWRD